jgi:hypothetical protein
MRWLLVGLLMSSCVAIPTDLAQRAQNVLNSSFKRTHVADHDVIGGFDVWTFCRSEARRGPFEPRTFDAACVVFTCPPGAAASRCDVAP